MLYARYNLLSPLQKLVNFMTVFLDRKDAAEKGFKEKEKLALRCDQRSKKKSLTTIRLPVRKVITIALSDFTAIRLFQQ